MDIEVVVNKQKSELVSLIYDSMITLHESMTERIFTDLKDSKGGSPEPYDTTPLWVSKKNWWTGVRDAGAPSKSGKTRYFKGGYSQLKAEIGRPPLELSGALVDDFSTALRKINDFEYHVVVDSENKNKIDRWFKGFFKPSEEEMEQLKSDLSGQAAK